MTSYNEGDIVLVHFSFTDLTSSKKRPAVILSPSDYASRFGDVVVLQLTGSGDRDPSLALSEWKALGLLKPTWVKPVMGTLSRSLVVRRLGAIAKADEASIRLAIRRLIANRWI